ncbi:hypothetical protein niasHT_021250 [Heterodera trifolii]|uniref:F-box domain-containing protein n=1 Tax=Heterodera trifolii TaxID=157864 RepID=A0ABD2I322_9BILA
MGSLTINNDVLDDVIAFIKRSELAQNFSLVSHHFNSLAQRRMHDANAHWVEGDCVFIANATTTRMIIPRGNNGGFEEVPVPTVAQPSYVLGFRGTIHFNGTVSDNALAFFRHALPPPTTLYRFSVLDEFYRANGLLSPFKTTERINTFLDTCMHLVELGGDEAFIGAFLNLPVMRQRVRKLRATRHNELFLKWLQQSDGEWRQLRIMRRISHEQRNRMIKNIFQHLLNNNTSSSSSSANDGPSSSSPSSVAVSAADDTNKTPTSSSPSPPIRFCIRLTVSDWGEPVQRLPFRWLGSSLSGQCVVLVERRPVDNLNVELCIVRCPYMEAVQRGFMDNAVTMDDLETSFEWSEPLCTVDVMHHRSDSTEDGNDDHQVALNEPPAIAASFLHFF